MQDSHDRLRILVVPSWYVSHARPYRGKNVYDQARALRDLGHTVVVLDAVPQDRNEIKASQWIRIDRRAEAGLCVYSLKMPGLLLGRLTLVYSLLYSFALARVLKRIRKDGFIPDIVHAHSIYPAGFGMVFNRRMLPNVPLVVTEHLSRINSASIDPSLSRLLSQTIKHSDAFISVSNALQDRVLEDVGRESVEGSKFLVVPNSIAPDFEYHPREESEHFNFLSVGNLVTIKRMDFLISAFAGVVEKHREARLRIVGEGPELARLIRLVDELELAQYVRFLGMMDTGRLKREYEKCDAFVLASASETFGIVYREAMAVGRPIVAVMNGGLQDDLDDRNGLFVEEKLVESLTHAMSEMVSTIDRFDLQSISMRCQEKYSASSVASKVLEVYGRALNE